jgi:hypothetical protein
MPSSI